MEKAINSIAGMDGVSKCYESLHGRTFALRNINFIAGPGELILLLGPSGSGKTTFLTLLAGLQQPTSGEIFLFGKKTSDYMAREIQDLRCKKIGFVFQTFLLLESLTVLQNVMMIRRFAGATRRECMTDAMRYLRRFGIEKLADSYPKMISQGEKQRAAIARALVNGAELIIADEPTGSLATEQGMEVVEYLRKSSYEEGRCVIIASHDERIIPHSDKVLRIKDGEFTEN